MKLSLKWIQDYVELDKDLKIEDLAYDLTMRTVEVEGYEYTGELVEGIVLGEILSLEQHPDADKLQICQVDVGQSQPLQIVCGGTNLYEGQRVAVAVPGALVKWHGEGEAVEIQVATLRGVESHGMICGASEINLEELFPVEEESHILDLGDFQGSPGDALAQVLELDDYILEIDNKSMTHRPDLWGHYGMARELAAIYGKSLESLPRLPDRNTLEHYNVEIQTENCLRYDALVYDHLEVRESPYALRRRLWSVGIRPISNLVDITNYVMLSTGQPTHGFDMEHVAKGILVRQANAHENLTLLDGRELDLSIEDMLITDGEKAIALAGVMGGKLDSILPNTKKMVLELASFNGRSVRRSSQRHNVRTEASTRYEKSIDTQRVEDAMAMAHNLITNLLPGSKLTAYGSAVIEKTTSSKIRLSYDFLASRIGREVYGEEIRSLLSPLGFKVLEESDSEIYLEAPVWRSTGDVSLADDIVEEIARMIGYENFEYKAPMVELNESIHQLDFDLERNLKEYLSFRAGYQEIYTYPWVHSYFIEAAGFETSEWVELEAPPSPEERFLRGSLVPSALFAIDKNLAYFDSFRFYELAQVFHSNSSIGEAEEVLPLQNRELVTAIVGSDPLTMFREAKGIIEELPSFIDCEALAFGQVSKPKWADPKVWLNIMDSSGVVIGSVGLISLKTERLAGIKHHRTVLTSLNVECLQALDSRENHYEALPAYPEVEKDLNVVVDESVSWAEIEDSLRGVVKRLAFVEEYRGKQVEEGKKSIMFRYWIGSDEKTLTSEEIETVSSQILHLLADLFKAKLRS